jgi:regulator of ribonuclease activity A
VPNENYKQLNISELCELTAEVGGDQLATLAVHNGWRGALVYGAIRDSRAIASMPIGLMALGTHPMKTEKKNQGDISIPLHFGGVMFVPDHWLYADEDGIIVSARPLIAP